MVNSACMGATTTGAMVTSTVHGVERPARKLTRLPLVLYFENPATNFLRCKNLTAAARSVPFIVLSDLLPRRSCAAGAALTQQVETTG